MKFGIDERLKHRLTGLIVILSIAVIFLPAVMKKSNQRLDENINISVRLPHKPPAPKVSAADEKTLFNQVKVAQVAVPRIQAESLPQGLAKAEPLSIQSKVPAAPVLASNNKASSRVISSASLVATEAVANVEPKVRNTLPLVNQAPRESTNAKEMIAHAEPAIPKTALKSEKIVYSIQLASFSQENNARMLVIKLKKQGYEASYSKSQRGSYYKVVVGSAKQMTEAKTLQKQLLASTQLHGFIVKTGVS